MLAALVACETLPQQVPEDISNIYGNEEMISLATGYSQPLDLAPGVSDVITAQEIEAMGATTLAEVLATVPGLHVSTVRGISDMFVIRGFFHESNAQVLVSVNGEPVSDVVNGGRPQGWSLPAQQIARIEIIRGPGSALDGSDAFAGRIDVITKTAKDINGTEVGLLGGSFDTYGAWLNAGRRWHDLDMALLLSARSTEGDDPIVAADAQTRLDTLFGTTASLAPGPIHTERDDIDVRFTIGHGERWRFNAGYQGFLNVGTGVGTALALDPNGSLDVQLVNADFTYRWLMNEDWRIDTQIGYLSTDTNVSLTLLPPGTLGGAFPDGVRNDFRFRVD
jgi:iron complex outermembrane receptor protein